MITRTYKIARETITNASATSAWARGVKVYAYELLGDLYDRSLAEGRSPRDRAEITDWLLNGAASWEEYSQGGCSLIYDGDIAERLCCPSAYKRSRYGERNPNARETWLDVQARALGQAARIVRAAWSKAAQED